MAEGLDLPTKLKGTIDRDIATVPSKLDAYFSIATTLVLSILGMLAAILPSATGSRQFGVATVPFVGALVLTAVVIVWSALVARRAWHLLGVLERGEEVDATVTYLSDERLTLSSKRGETIVLDWRQLVDVFERKSGLSIAWSGDDAKIPLFRRLVARKKWETSEMETGQKVELLLEPRHEDGSPYRSGLSLHDSIAYVLHGNVMASHLRSALFRLAFARWFPRPLLLVGLLVLIFGLSICSAG